MIDLKNNTKTEIQYLKISVKNYLASIHDLYSYYDSNIIEEKLKSMVVLLKETTLEPIDINEDETRIVFQNSFNIKRSVNVSLYIFSISILENTLKEIAIIINKSTDGKTEKGRGKQIQKTYRWINEKTNVDKSFKEWSNLIDYYEIRNQLVHNAGIISECKVKKYLRKYKSFNLTYDKYWGLIIERDFLKKTIGDIDSFLQQYFVEIDKSLITKETTI